MSKLFTLNWKDLLKGFITAVISAILTGVYQAIEAGKLEFTWLFWQPILYVGIGAGIAYLLKNFLTNSGDQFAKAEKP